MKAKTLTVCCCLLLVMTLILGGQYISVREDKDFLQKNIDGQFTYNLSSLNTNLFNRENIDEVTISELDMNAEFCRSLFTCTSYSKNTSLQNIMLSLAGMVPPDAEYEPIKDRKLIDDIGYLLQCLNEPDSKELAESVWDTMSKELQKQG